VRLALDQCQARRHTRRSWSSWVVTVARGRGLSRRMVPHPPPCSSAVLCTQDDPMWPSFLEPLVLWPRVHSHTNVNPVSSAAQSPLPPASATQLCAGPVAAVCCAHCEWRLQMNGCHTASAFIRPRRVRNGCRPCVWVRSVHLFRSRWTGLRIQVSNLYGSGLWNARFPSKVRCPKSCVSLSVRKAPSLHDFTLMLA